MNKKHIHFSLIACALCAGVLSDAFAAPSVKRLGGMNTYTGTSGAVSAKANANSTTNSGSRLSSVRTNRSTNKTTSIKPTTSGTAANASRLSVGQYLHNAGVVSGKIKPISGSSGSSITPSGIDDIRNDIADLRNLITNTYVTKTEIQNNYYTTEQINNTYATKTEVNTVSDKVSGIDERLTAVENSSSSANTVDDWNANKPSWAN